MTVSLPLSDVSHGDKGSKDDDADSHVVAHDKEEEENEMVEKRIETTVSVERGNERLDTVPDHDNAPAVFLPLPTPSTSILRDDVVDQAALEQVNSLACQGLMTSTVSAVATAGATVDLETNGPLHEVLPTIGRPSSTRCHQTIVDDDDDDHDDDSNNYNEGPSNHHATAVDWTVPLHELNQAVEPLDLVEEEEEPPPHSVVPWQEPSFTPCSRTVEHQGTSTPGTRTMEQQEAPSNPGSRIHMEKEDMDEEISSSLTTVLVEEGRIQETTNDQDDIEAAYSSGERSLVREKTNLKVVLISKRVYCMGSSLVEGVAADSHFLDWIWVFRLGLTIPRNARNRKMTTIRRRRT